MSNSDSNDPAIKENAAIALLNRLFGKCSVEHNDIGTCILNRSALHLLGVDMKTSAGYSTRMFDPEKFGDR